MGPPRQFRHPGPSSVARWCAPVRRFVRVEGEGGLYVWVHGDRVDEVGLDGATTGGWTDYASALQDAGPRRSS
jgi:hypothetical protein